MTTVLKYLTCLLVVLPIGLFAQSARDTKLLNACKQEVSAINSMPLCKKTAAYGALAEGSENVSLTSYRGIADGFLIYFDAEGRIRKFITLLDYPESYGFSIHYFDKNGYAVNSVHFCRSAMDTALNGTRYLNKGALVYLDIELRGETDEVLSATEQYGGKMKRQNDFKFNAILHTDSLARFCKKEELVMDSDCKKIMFSSPTTGDKTVVNVRRANIRTLPSTNSKVVAIAELGDIAEVREANNKGWYKVHINGVVGYISSTLLEPIEHGVNK